MLRGVVMAFGICALLAACDLSRPWQPTRAPLTETQIEDAALDEKADSAIGAYNLIPESLGQQEQEFLKQLSLSLPRGADFRIWRERSEPKRISRLGLRSLGVESRRSAEILISVFVAKSERRIERWAIARSARYTPASWDYDLTFSSNAPDGQANREINRLHAELGASPLQGRVYLDATIVEPTLITASLRDRRFKTSVEEEAEILANLRELYRGFEVSFTSRDVMDGPLLKQRIYDIRIAGDFRGLPAEVSSAAPLRWSPDGGPQHDPAPADNDANRRLIERENAKYR